MDRGNTEYLLSKIVSDLSIERKFIRLLENNKALLLVPKNWLHQVERAKSLPNICSEFDLSDEQCDQILKSKSPSIVTKSWSLTLLHIIPKNRGKVYRLPDKQRVVKHGSGNLTFSQLIHYVSETNYKNLWKNTYNKYQQNHKEHKSRKNELQSYNSAVREIINRLYGCSLILCSKREDFDSSFNEQSIDVFKTLEHCHPNLLPVYFALESVDHFYLIHPFLQHTLYDCVTYSPAALSLSTGRCLFVFYQLLQCLRHLADLGLHLGNISLPDVYLNQEIWVQVTPKLWESMLSESEAIEIKRRSESREKSHESKKREEKSKKKLLLDYLNMWVKGQISNYNYLMELNKLAGREMENPKHHPVLPWIIDFTSPDGGWRDLSKSKYRLTKGDRQLDLTYESSSSHRNSFSGQPLVSTALSVAIHVPHHFSEVLSDITYYVYKARRLPKSVLRAHVRSNWVPAEYPASMQRLQVWTPDECIPEFFTDPSIFKSIHEDLSDLEIPSWCNDAQDFVNKHMNLLESDHVSERLHHWIDLTFGFKLSGLSAVKSKNVCLPLVDQHTNLNSAGMTQLFSQPHPHKMASSIFSGRKAPKTFRSVSQKSILQSFRTKENLEIIDKEQINDSKDTAEDESENSGTSSSKSDKTDSLKNLKRSKSMLVTSTASLEQSKLESRPENQVIVLPKDYNPLAALQQVESLFQFTSQTLGTNYSEDLDGVAEEKGTFSPHRSYKSWDMANLGCLLCQMVLPSRFHVVPKDLPLKDKYQLVIKILQAHSQELPKCAFKAIQLLLQVKIPIVEVSLGLPSSYLPITSEGLPPISAHQLLQPLISLLPFSAYYEELYIFICQLNKFDKELYFAERLNLPEEDRLKLVHEIADEKVTFTSQKLPHILPKLDSEGVNLLIPFLLHMFNDRWTCLLAVWHLFDPIAQTLGVHKAGVKLVSMLTRLLDPDVPSTKHLKLYHRSCLLQWIVRLGLQSFLTHFVTMIIEATGGVRDFHSEGLDNIDNNSDTTDYIRKSSYLQSAELEILATDETVNLDGNVSPYDEDSMHTALTSQESVTNEGSEFQSAEEYRSTSENELLHNEPEIFAFDSTEEELPNIKNGDEIDTWGENSPSNSKNEASSDSEENESNKDGDVFISTGPIDPTNDSAQSFDTTDLNNISWMTRSSDKGPLKLSNNGSFPHKKSPNGGSDDAVYNISDVAAESVLWLAHRLGPVLTAKHLSRNLLKMLTLCYLGPEPKQITRESVTVGSMRLSLTGKFIVGDHNASKVLDCLGNIAELYGENFIISQYLPQASDVVNICKRRITDNMESGLIGMLSLVQFIVPYLSDATLMDQLQDLIIKEILYPSSQLVTSIRFTYSGGSIVRRAIASKLINVIYIIGRRIGFEMTRKHLSAIMKRFFSAFEKAHEQLAHSLASSESPSLRSFSEDYIEIKKCSVSDEYVIDSAVRIKCGSAESLSPQPNSTSKPKTSNQPLDELKEVFTPEFCFSSYIPFCQLAGGIFMEQTLKCDSLLRNLCFLHDQSTETKIKQYQSSPSKDASRFEDLDQLSLELGPKENTPKNSAKKGKEEISEFVSGEFGSNVEIVGNRINVNFAEDRQSSSSTMEPLATNSEIRHLSALHCEPEILHRKMENNYRHLKGNWRAYWEHEIGRSDKDQHFNFKQIKLQSFVGHTGSVRAIHALDNENSFITGSKDKTVKLWSLRSCGDGSNQSPCQWTYPNHKKSVFSVAFLDSLRLVASCDSTVHIWDPFIGSCIKQLDSSKSSPVTLLTAMPSPSTSFIVATTNSTIRFLDSRTCSYMHEFKVTLGPAGLIRCLSSSPDSNWIAIGHSSGIISVLDIRTGLLLGSKNCHEGEILQVKAFNNSCFVSSSLDHSVAVWQAEDIKLKCHLRGPMEPVTCLNFYKGEVISGTTANRIGVHSSIDHHSSYQSTRLMSETFKGVLTSMSVLSVNRLLLLGADNGNVSLFC